MSIGGGMRLKAGHQLTLIHPHKSVLGTPTDEEWPGVKSLPDYKSSFPQWNGTPLDRAVPTLDESGIDLLKSMLIYDPAGRISGE